jgi:hypothetical protein
MVIELNSGFLQNWPSWAENHYLDVLIPMTYSSRVNEMKGLTYWVNTFLLGNLPAFAGIQAFNLPDIKTSPKWSNFSRLGSIARFSHLCIPYLNTNTRFLKTRTLPRKCEAPSRKLPTSLVPLKRSKSFEYFTPIPNLRLKSF